MLLFFPEISRVKWPPPPNLAVGKIMEGMCTAYAKNETRSQYVSNKTWREQSRNIHEYVKGKHALFAKNILKFGIRFWISSHTHFRIFVRKFLVHLCTVYASSQKLAWPMFTHDYLLCSFGNSTPFVHRLQWSPSLRILLWWPMITNHLRAPNSLWPVLGQVRCLTCWPAEDLGGQTLGFRRSLAGMPVRCRCEFEAGQLHSHILGGMWEDVCSDCVAAVGSQWTNRCSQLWSQNCPVDTSWWGEITHFRAWPLRKTFAICFHLYNSRE